jgi:hypothetical protein
MLLAGVVQVGVGLCCGVGFLASFELGFRNVFHARYGAAGVAALAGAVWLVVPAVTRMPPAGATHPSPSGYWRPMRLAALFSLFSLRAITPGGIEYLGFLLFLLFLLPIPLKQGTGP